MESELFELEKEFSKLSLESRSKLKLNVTNKEFSFASIGYRPYALSTNSIPSASFSILSYNILADCYASTFKTRVPPKYVDFSFRGPNVINDIKTLSSDIVCLQEVDNFYEFYETSLQELNYEPVFVKRPHKYQFDGLVLAVKKDIFQIESIEFMEFGKPFNNSFKKGNIAIAARLKHKASGEFINVINTHLYWDPKFENVKYSQMSELMLGANYIHKEKNEPIILVGDFNSMPNSNLMQYILKGSPPKVDALEGRNADLIKSMMKTYCYLMNWGKQLPWASAYQFYGRATSNYGQTFPNYTNYKSRFQATLDHILYVGSGLVPKELLKIPTPEEIGTSDIPNERFPSDHLPIMVRFNLFKTSQ